MLLHVGEMRHVGLQRPRSHVQARQNRRGLRQTSRAGVSMEWKRSICSFRSCSSKSGGSTIAATPASSRRLIVSRRSVSGEGPATNGLESDSPRYVVERSIITPPCPAEGRPRVDSLFAVVARLHSGAGSRSCEMCRYTAIRRSALSCELDRVFPESLRIKLLYHLEAGLVRHDIPRQEACRPRESTMRGGSPASVRAGGHNGRAARLRSPRRVFAVAGPS